MENEEIKYSWILIMKENNNYLQWSPALEKPKAADCHDWIKWNKPLPDDIDSSSYKYVDGELVKES